MKPLDLASRTYWELKTAIVQTERHILKELGFIITVTHPHKFIINYLNVMDASPQLIQTAWNYANDRYAPQCTGDSQSHVCC